MKPHTIQMGPVQVYRDPAASYVCSTWPEGHLLHARPQPGPEQVRTAKEQGFADVGELTLTHDPLHHLACRELFGLEFSPTLFHEAGGEEASAEWRALEEVVVAYCCRCLNGREHPYGRLGDVIRAAACLRRGEG